MARGDFSAPLGYVWRSWPDGRAGMQLSSFLIQILNSLQYGLLLFLIASGLTLTLGIMGIINVAHGSFYMIGAYLAYSLSSLTGNFLLSILIGVPLTVALGALLEWLLLSRLYRR